MRVQLTLSIMMVICFLTSSMCFADVVHFNNGFTYEGKVAEDAETGGYWIDGALVNKSEIKSIEKREVNTARGIKEEKKQAWYTKFFSALSSFKKDWSAKRKSQLDTTTKANTSTVSQSRLISKPKQATSSQARINYRGTSRSVWQNIRRNSGLNSRTNRQNNAGYITKRDRIREFQARKRNNAGYLLGAERQKNKNQSGLLRRNSAGYELSRQRRLTDRQLSSFGSSVGTKY